ncbi:c-type cytochrome [Riemerella anatipestifer]
MRRSNAIFTVLLGVMLVSCTEQVDKGKAEYVFDTSGMSDLMRSANQYFKPVSITDKGDFSEDMINLGQKLYFDKRLSKNETISCNSCHNLSTFGVDNLPTSPGDTKVFGGRNSPTVIYASLHSQQFWDGRAKDVEEQAGMPILNPIEHNIPSEKFLEDRLRQIPEYQALFKKAFPNEAQPVTYKNLTKAIGSFERQLLPESRFDKYLNGDENALTQKEKDGLKAFIDNACIACHNGPAVGGGSLQKFGVYADYWNYTKSKKVDLGRQDVTKDEKDKYLFKVPSLRNVEKTYPYFHDGSVASLEEAVRIMSKIQNNKDISDKDVENIVAFLKSLTTDIDNKYKTVANK